MTQDALFTESHWTDRYTEGQVVTDALKGEGVVIEVKTGGLLIRWEGHPTFGEWICFHGSEMGLS